MGFSIALSLQEQGLSDSGKINITINSCKLFTNMILSQIVPLCILCDKLTFATPMYDRNPEHIQMVLIQPSSDSTFNTNNNEEA